VGAKSAARDIYFAPDLEWLPILRIQGHTISSFGAPASVAPRRDKSHRSNVAARLSAKILDYATGAIIQLIERQNLR
jgi:hypothetical protein